MPSRSNKQRKFLYANKGPAWVKAHHFDKVKSKKTKRGKGKK